MGLPCRTVPRDTLPCPRVLSFPKLISIIGRLAACQGPFLGGVLASLPRRRLDALADDGRGEDTEQRTRKPDPAPLRPRPRTVSSPLEGLTGRFSCPATPNLRNGTKPPGGVGSRLLIRHDRRVPEESSRKVNWGMTSVARQIRPTMKAMVLSLSLV
jgi:hypothetical protein